MDALNASSAADAVADDRLASAALVSPRWVQWRRTIDIADYDQRFARMAADGEHVHGEADFISARASGALLDAGCGTGRIAIELATRGFDVTGVDLDADMIAAARAKAPALPWLVDDLARMQLQRRFDLVAMPGNVMLFCEPADRRLIIHNIAQHLLPGGVLVAGFTLERDGYTLAEWDDHCRSSGLEPVERFASWSHDPFLPDSGYHVSVHRRTMAFTVHDLLAEARDGLERMTPHEVAAALRDDPDILVVDTRLGSDCAALGRISGCVQLQRTVLEWRADPLSGYSDPVFTEFDRRIVIVCNDGYSSSLAAANLQRLGYHRATDMIGGFMAWRRAGLPIEILAGT